MRLDTFLVADAAITSEGKLNILGGGVTRLSVPAIPFIVPRIAIVTRFVFERDEDSSELHHVSITLTDPDGTPVFQPSRAQIPLEGVDDNGPVLAAGEERVAQQLVEIVGLKVDTRGAYEVVVTLDDEPVRTMNLPLIVTGD